MDIYIYIIYIYTYVCCVDPSLVGLDPNPLCHVMAFAFWRLPVDAAALDTLPAPRVDRAPVDFWRLPMCLGCPWGAGNQDDDISYRYYVYRYKHI
jgi:hypothetical protein